MAKTYNRDKDKPARPAATSFSFNNDVEQLEVVKLSKRQKVLGYSFILIALIMLISYIIPEKYYDRDLNIVLLNIELLVLFARDMYLYFMKSCKLVRVIMGLMSGIYVLNCMYILLNFKYFAYLEISAIVIVIALAVLSIVTKSKK